MPAPLPRIALAILLMAPVAAGAQAPTPPRPAAHPPAHREAAPIVAPRPGAPAQRPHARPAPHRPAPHRPAAPPPAPVPAPAPEPERPAEPPQGSNSGLPLPRFAALKSDEVNLRTGPGTRYPIDWVYKRRDLPVQVEREFELWRLVRDQEGVRGWVNQATLAPRRTAVVIGAEQALRRDAREDAAPVARLKPGVIVRLRSCEAASDWCQAQVGDYRGWLKRGEVWGMLPGEAIQ